MEVAAEVLHRHRKRNDSQVPRPLTASYSPLQPLTASYHPAHHHTLTITRTPHFITNTALIGGRPLRGPNPDPDPDH